MAFEVLQSVFVPGNNIFIFTQTKEEHLWHVQRLLQQLLQHQLFVKAKKCLSSNHTVLLGVDHLIRVDQDGSPEGQCSSELAGAQGL